ncbi:MAG: hypothetical protein R3D00_23235 [Bacteroidia bacterium]
MSAVVKTVTPFLNLELLLQSLDAIGCKYKINLQRNEIVTERKDYQGNQKFLFINNRFIYQHDSDANRMNWNNLNNKESKTVSSFLEAVETKYQFFYNKKMEELEKQRQEEERIRLEKERQAFVESQRENIIAKAKEKGYSIQEEKVKGKIKLVLVRNTY